MHQFTKHCAGNRSYRNVSTNVPNGTFIAVSSSHLIWRQFLQTHCSYQTPTHSCFPAHRFDFHNKNVTVEGRVPELNFTGSYKLNEKIVEHRVQGNGPFHLSYRYVLLPKQMLDNSLHLVCNTNTNNDQQHYTAATCSYSSHRKSFPPVNWTWIVPTSLPYSPRRDSHVPVTGRSDNLHSVPVALSTESLTVKTGYGHELTEVNTGKHYTVRSEIEGTVSVLLYIVCVPWVYQQVDTACKLWQNILKKSTIYHNST